MKNLLDEGFVLRLRNPSWQACLRAQIYMPRPIPVSPCCHGLMKRLIKLASPEMSHDLLREECSSHTYREAVDMGHTLLSADEAIRLDEEQSKQRLYISQTTGVKCRLRLCLRDWPRSGPAAASRSKKGRGRVKSQLAEITEDTIFSDAIAAASVTLFASSWAPRTEYGVQPGTQHLYKLSSKRCKVLDRCQNGSTAQLLHWFKMGKM